jgi:hypothetical protein
VLEVLKSDSENAQKRRHQLRSVKDMKDIVSGTISRFLSLLPIQGEMLVASRRALREEIIELQAFLVLSLLSARSWVDSRSLPVPKANFEEWVMPLKIEAVPGDESFDAVFRLLQWCHRRILMDKRFDEFLKKEDKEPWLTDYRSFLGTTDGKLEMERYCDGALRPWPTWSEIDVRSGRVDVDAVYGRLAREEQWMRLALLQVEIFAENKDLHPFLSKLVDQVGKRLKRRATAPVGYLPPWGFRCLDHLLEMDLAVAKKRLGYSRDDLQDKIQVTYENCLYFLKSDLSFIKSRDTADPTWMEDHWNMDFSNSVCSSFLEATKLLQKEPGSLHNLVPSPTSPGRYSRIRRVSC